MAFSNTYLQKMTVTGILILLMGLITMMPEIYLSGILILALSSLLQVKELERIVDTQEESEHLGPLLQGST